MSKLQTSCIAAALSLLGAALAQAQQPPPKPQPATQQTEGTAADRTRPGATPTENAPTQAENPRPSTSEAEGTAADRTPPGQTPTGRDAQRSELVGAAVVTTTQAPLGEVVDVVFDARNQPAFVVISTEGKSVAVPYSVASSTKTSDGIVMDRARLRAAPKVKEGEWKKESGGTWKDESTRYWKRS